VFFIRLPDIDKFYLRQCTHTSIDEEMGIVKYFTTIVKDYESGEVQKIPHKAWCYANPPPPFELLCNTITVGMTFSLLLVIFIVATLTFHGY
jgi:uncharacterized protein (DUF427 family)